MLKAALIAISSGSVKLQGMKRVRKAKRTLAGAVIVGASVVMALLAMEPLAEGDEPEAPASAASATFPVGPSEVTATRHSRVAVIVMENKEYGQVIGSPAAPYLNSLARRYGLATRFFAVTHPSLPNYLALTTGSTQGLHTDCTDCTFAGSNLLTQLSSAGFSWKTYVAGVPGSCYRGARASNYVKPLNPFVYLQRLTRDPALCSSIVPIDRLTGDLQAGSLPTCPGSRSASARTPTTAASPPAIAISPSWSRRCCAGSVRTERCSSSGTREPPSGAAAGSREVGTCLQSWLGRTSVGVPASPPR